jgi:biopolymer transport protein ExbD
LTIRRRRRRLGEDSGASSDIAFLLIIYFIVIAGFNVNRGFIMNLPARDSTRLILREELLRFELDGAGSLFYRGKPLDRGGAEREIRAAVAERPNLAVILTVDPRAPWQEVVSFVELAQKLAVVSFSFTMQGAGGAGP